VSLKKTVIIYHYGYFLAPVKLPHPVIVDLLDVTEAVTGEIIPHKFQKPDLLGKKGIFILFGFSGDVKTFIIRNCCIIVPMLVKPTKLPPVNIPVFISFTVKHVWINAAYGKTAFIYPALSVFQEPAGSVVIIPYPYCIPGDVKNTVLVTEFGCRCRFDSSRINFFYYGYITIKQENVSVECSGTAFCT
jgi:hypothetical protein